jgi:hypothetical protein
MKGVFLLIFLVACVYSWGFNNIIYNLIKKKFEVKQGQGNADLPKSYSVGINIDASTTEIGKSPEKRTNMVYDVNVYSIGTYICVANANPDLDPKLMAQCSKNSTNLDGTINGIVVETFQEPYKTAFLNAKPLLPTLCSNITYPNDQLYNSVRVTSNPLPSIYQFPRAIYTINSEANIVNTIIGLNLLDPNTFLKLRVHSGGHDYRGFSSTGVNSYVIVTTLLNQVIYDKKNNLATIYTGNSNMNVYKLLNEYGVVVPSGYSPTPGAGIYLSSGFSPFARDLGLDIDNVLGVRVVLPDGTTRDEKKGSDLFWNIIGGGSENFGVAVYVNVSTYPSPKGASEKNPKDPSATGVVFLSMYNGTKENFKLVFSKYQEILSVAPNYLAALLQLKADTTGNQILFAGYCNSTLENCINAYKPFNESFPKPTYYEFAPSPFYDAWVTYLSGCSPKADGCNEQICFNNFTKMYYCTDPIDSIVNSSLK